MKESLRRLFARLRPAPAPAPAPAPSRATPVGETEVFVAADLTQFTDEIGVFTRDLAGVTRTAGWLTPDLPDVSPDALAITRAHAHLGAARRHVVDADRAATQWIATDNPETAAVYGIALAHQLTEAQAAVRAALEALAQRSDR